MQRVWVEDEPIIDGNSDRAKKNDFYLPVVGLQQRHTIARQIYLRSAVSPYTNYEDKLARCYLLSQYPILVGSAQGAGMFPGIVVQHISLDGSLHFSDDGFHYQQFYFDASGALMSPDVFLAIVYDHGAPSHWLEPESTQELRLPILSFDNTFNMTNVKYDDLPLENIPATPYPQAQTIPPMDRRFEVIWSRTFIAPQDPSLVYETLREEQEPPYPEPPLEFKREYRWLPRTIYFRADIDCHCPILFDRKPASNLGVAGEYLVGVRGNLHFIAWRTGGRANGATAQNVYLNVQTMQSFNLNKS